MTALHYRWQGLDLVLSCHIQANAQSTRFCGRYGERIKVRIAAPAVAGRANQALVRFVADSFAVAPSQITLLRGHSGRQKQLLIQRPQHLPAACEIIPAQPGK
jgi:uncharacterized protein (TIGR00251 family)